MSRLPNILFITLDQWRADALEGLTPSLTALAGDTTATKFTGHYCQAFPCGPSRASLLTGLYVEQHRIRRNEAVLDAEFSTVFQLLRQVGYQPALFGYTDVADPIGANLDPTRPQRNGMDVETLLNYQAALWIEHLRSAGYRLPAAIKDRDQIFQLRRFEEPTLFDQADSEAAFLTDRFLHWLPADDRQPFCAHLAFISPHPPFAVAAPFHQAFQPSESAAPCRGASPEIEAAQHPFMRGLLETVDVRKFAPGLGGLSSQQSLETIRRVKAIYAGQVMQVDAQLGRLFDSLKRRGLWDNTVVVVTADHGEQLFDHWLLGKTGYFDQSAHVPLIVRLPADKASLASRSLTEEPANGGSANRPEAAFSVAALTESIDIVPTLLELAGIAPPALCQGRSLLPWCRGETPAAWRNEVHWQFDFGRVSNGRLSRSLNLTAALSRLDVVRTERLKYVHFHGLPPVLFDLETDPFETVNRAGDVAAQPLLEHGEARWHAWRLRQEIPG